nr:MAG TPA: hypothetical protein [Caudoviricetes sp.]
MNDCRSGNSVLAVSEIVRIIERQPPIINSLITEVLLCLATSSEQ